MVAGEPIHRTRPPTEAETEPAGGRPLLRRPAPPAPPLREGWELVRGRLSGWYYRKVS